MKVTDGALTAEFRTLRLPLGTGLLGLVAQTGAPYFTEDYQADERFVHRQFIDDAVAGEQIRAILGVPLVVDGRVIGALLAVHRTVRRSRLGGRLLTSFAAHAVGGAGERPALRRASTRPTGRMTRSTRRPSSRPPTRTTGSPTCCCTAAASTRSPRVLAEVLGGRRGPRRRRDAARGLAGRGRLATGVADSRARPARARSRPAPGYVAAAGRRPSTSPRWCCTDRARPSRRPSGAPSSAARWSPRWCCCSRRTVRADRGAARRRAAHRPARRARRRPRPALRERARRQRVVLDPPLAVAVASVARFERHAAARVAARSPRPGAGSPGSTAGRSWCWCPGR